MPELRALAFAEGISLLLLVGVAVPLKHAFGLSEGVRVLGPLHGIAFLLYVVRVLEALGTGNLTRREAGLAVVAAFVPAGTFVFARWMARRG